MNANDWNFEATNVAAFLIPGVVIPSVLLILAFVQPTRRQMNRWAAVCGVALTETNREQVRSHLTRVRRFRSAAAFPLWWLAWVPLINSTFPSHLATPLPALVAYVAGALVAEVTGGTGHIPATVERRAALMTRTMDDYGPAWARRLPYVLLAVGVLTVTLAQTLQGPEPVGRPVVVVALATAFAAGTLLAGHRIVRRPQRGAEPDVLAADDALRATGISSAYAAATLGGLWAAWTGMGSLVPERVRDWWLLLATAGYFASVVLSIGFLTVIIRQDTWGYRRRHRQARTTASAVPA